LLAIIGQEGEDISAIINGGNTTTAKEESPAALVTETISATTESVVIPEGTIIVNMPRLSDTMEEGTVASWLKSVGDKIEEGDILAEIETDKATMEFESFNEGTLLHIGVQVGESTPVDSLLAIIGNAGTDVSALIAAQKTGSLTNDPPALKETKKEEAPKNPVIEAKAAPVANTAVNTSNGDKVFASPLAKKIAKDKGFNLTDIKGSGENGRIIKKDVESFTPVAKAELANSTVTNFAIAGEEKTEEIKNSSMRKAIAKALGKSKFTAPHFYLNIEVDMDNAMASRKLINAIPDTKVSFNDMVVKACAMALVKHPQVNTSWTDNTTKIHSHIHVGVAVAVDEGLVVPVIKHTNALSLTQIGASVRDLAGKARKKKISPAEMQGSTFTVSNLGMFGIQSFTSIINQPNSAILSVGAIVQKPVVKDGQIVVGNTMMLSLACDHRTVDGAVGAGFLQTLKTFIENPVTMIA